VTYNTRDDHFTSDNTDIRFVNITKLSGKELVYGLDLNNNPTVEDLWNSTPAWGYPWVASDFAPTPGTSPILMVVWRRTLPESERTPCGTAISILTQRFTARNMWAVPSRIQELLLQNNIRGVAPYWRAAWQQSTATTQFEVGTYGIHMQSTPNAIVGLENEFTDFAFDTQIDRTLFRKDVLSFRGTYIHENSDLLAAFVAGAAAQRLHHLNTVMANAEYHFGNRVSGTFGWFNTSGTPDPLLFAPGAVSGLTMAADQRRVYRERVVLGLAKSANSRLNTPATPASMVEVQTMTDPAAMRARTTTIYLDAKFISKNVRK